jgi:hypothetical protein
MELRVLGYLKAAPVVYVDGTISGVNLVMCPTSAYTDKASLMTLLVSRGMYSASLVESPAIVCLLGLRFTSLCPSVKVYLEMLLLPSSLVPK